MAVARGFSFPETFAAGLDELLLGVCEELQLTSARHDLAVERYNTLNKVLEGKESPFRYFRPERPLRQIEERRSEALAADQSFSTSHTTTRSKIFFSHTFPA